MILGDIPAGLVYRAIARTSGARQVGAPSTAFASEKRFMDRNKALNQVWDASAERTRKNSQFRR